ncbi:transposase domain-containing protein [Streptomyces jumonjinensis]|uniref:transposase domain-containing protein n=1 Tax=Streptomyces jumonjinensis TaxID=1945 RepID=UPI00378EDA0B
MGPLLSRGSTKIFSKAGALGFSLSGSAPSDVFAPGHLGELNQVVPPGLVDAILEETGTRERWLRCLPYRVG